MKSINGSNRNYNNGEKMDWEIKELGMEYDALEPYIDAMTMKTHYEKHYKGYHAKALAALEGKDLQSVEKTLLTDLRPVIQNNGGGFYNHTLFWSILGINQGKGPFGHVGKGIDKGFKSFENFKEKFSDAAANLFGSGWVFLVYDEDSKECEIIVRHNQDHPLCGKKVLMGLDVWEHAYYLHYQNRRPDYIKAFWNVVDWEKVEHRFLSEKAFHLTS
jgi:Fe-Mn family superoxide dismutase